MKRTFTLMIALAFVLIAAGHAPARGKGKPQGKPFQVSHEDGTYRGIFADSGDIQVSLQFTLVDNVVTDIRFRWLFYRGIDYRTNPQNDPFILGIRQQYQALIDHLVGKDIRFALKDLYQPGDIVQWEVDGRTGATLRSSKIISAARDALNRGVYSY